MKVPNPLGPVVVIANPLSFQISECKKCVRSGTPLAHTNRCVHCSCLTGHWPQKTRRKRRTRRRNGRGSAKGAEVGSGSGRGFGWKMNPAEQLLSAVCVHFSNENFQNEIKILRICNTHAHTLICTEKKKAKKKKLFIYKEDFKGLCRSICKRIWSLGLLIFCHYRGFRF